MQSCIIASLIVVLAMMPQGTISACTHPVFCNGEVLQTVANSSVFTDSKRFVDLVLSKSVEEVLDNFKKQDAKSFIGDNFGSDPEIILEPATFPDFNPHPAFLEKISDPELRSFAQELHDRWNELGKRVVLSNSIRAGTCVDQCSTLLKEMDGRVMLVPGGRFRESYYWDSYWIVLGLIAGDMLDTVENLIENFAGTIRKYGFIPNGFREYYLNRSQPPFFALMLQKLTQRLTQKGQREKAIQLQKQYMQILLMEHDFWEKNRSVNITINSKTFKMNQYRADTTTARPESFKEDMETLKAIANENQRKRVFQAISSMAESGWDFSSRWLEDPHDLSSTRMDMIVPSDLNAILGLQESYLASVSTRLGRADLVHYFVDKIEQRRQYFKAIKTADERYPDKRIDNPSSDSPSIYPSDYLPHLLFQTNPSLSTVYSDLVNPATSKLHTGQQWDQPNVWAPCNWMIHQVAPFPQAFQFASQWVKTTYCSWKKTGNLYEKYRNDKWGERGQGGEYEVQTGFGWTNGLTLHYLYLYGSDMTLEGCE